MTDTSEIRLQEVFTAAVALPPNERASYLDRACVGDARFRARVEALLKAHESAGDFLGAPAGFADMPTAALVGQPGQHIGRYKLLQQIGEGGFGTVFLAEQQEPVRRRVALKIIKLGMDTRQVIARFEAERQALAIMDHPNIAKVHDAGATDTGRPYFVMELVRGVPVTDYCDQQHLTPRQRLELFIPICQAVQHAHQKGVIHRDIKPSNVLVSEQDGKPVPKIIDFGIAKATQSRLTERTVFTELRQLIGTPAYMSPEQASVEVAVDIDTRSDIYSLGVLLYELLTGTTPLESKDLLGAAYDQMQRMIREQEAPRPSTRLSTMGDAIASIAAVRRVEPRQLSRFVRDELDWIVMKCLEKDRARRYDSAAALAADIQRQLAGEAVLAGPPSALYRIKKTALRHRVALGVAAVALVVAGAGMTLYIRGIRAEQRKTELALIEAQKQKDEAKSQSEIAQAVSEFLTERVLAGARPEHLPDKSARDAVVKAMLDPASAVVAQDFRNKPLTEAAVRNSLAVSYRAIGRADLGLPHAQAALALRRRALGNDHPDTLSSINDTATLLQSVGEFDEAQKLFREAMERSRRVLGENHSNTLSATNNLATLLQDQGKFEQAEPLFRASLEGSRRALGDDHPNTLRAMNNLALLLQAQGKLDEAEPLYRESLERRRRVLGDDHPETLVSINNVGYLLQAQGKPDEAEPLNREALGRSRRVMGDDHPDTLTSINNVATLLLTLGKLDEAEPLFREVLERSRRVLGDDHPDTLIKINNMAVLLRKQNKLDEAEPLYREALERSRRVLGDDHPQTLNSISYLAVLLRMKNKLDEAEPLHREAVTRAKAHPSLGPNHPQTKQFATSYARCLDAMGRNSDAAAVRKEFELPDPATQAATAPTTAPATQPAPR